MNTANSNTSHIRRIIERSNQHLGCTFEILRFGNILDNRIEQSGYIVGRFPPICRKPTLFGRTVYRREIKLFFGCIETKHKVENHLLDFVRAAIRFIHFIDDHNWFQSHFDSLLQNKTSLRHRALEGID